MLNKFKKTVKTVEKIEQTEQKPVDKKDIEALISLINTAHNIECDFDLCLTLSIGNFKVNSDAFNGIKLISKKNEEEKLLIQHKNMLLSNDTSINLKDIHHIMFNLKFYDKGEQDV